MQGCEVTLHKIMFNIDIIYIIILSAEEFGLKVDEPYW